MKFQIISYEKQIEIFEIQNNNLLRPIAHVNFMFDSILTKRYFPRIACAHARQTGTSSDWSFVLRIDTTKP
jgi:hypothetical protein